MNGHWCIIESNETPPLPLRVSRHKRAVGRQFIMLRIMNESDNNYELKIINEVMNLIQLTVKVFRMHSKQLNYEFKYKMLLIFISRFLHLQRIN